MEFYKIYFSLTETYERRPDNKTGNLNALKSGFSLGVLSIKGILVRQSNMLNE